MRRNARAVIKTAGVPCPLCHTVTLSTHLLVSECEFVVVCCSWHLSLVTVSFKEQNPDLSLSSGCAAAFCSPQLLLPVGLIPLISTTLSLPATFVLCKDASEVSIPFTIWHVRWDKNKPKYWWCGGVRRSRWMRWKWMTKALWLMCWLPAAPAVHGLVGMVMMCWWLD